MRQEAVKAKKRINNKKKEEIMTESILPVFNLFV